MQMIADCATVQKPGWIANNFTKRGKDVYSLFHIYFCRWITFIILKNFDLDSVVTPVDWRKFEDLLKQTTYNQTETDFLVNGFKNGFDIGYHGARNWDSENSI